MNLTSILRGYPAKEKIGNLNVNITGIKNDSRKIEKGNIFVAIKGYNYNGQLFIDDAVKNGAICIITEDTIEIQQGVTFIKVEDILDAQAYISSVFYNFPSKGLNMIGITGTNGKTSISYYIRSILDAYKIKTGIIGTTGFIIQEDISNIKNTTPDSLTLQESLFGMVEKEVASCIMEVSSHGLALKRVEYIDFDIGIFSNLTKDHLDYHITMDNYFESKLKLFYKTTKYNIINTDDKYGKKIIEKLGNRVKLLTYGIKDTANVYATNIKYKIDCVSFTLNYQEESIEITINIPGEFSVYNALAASSCAIAMNIELNTIKKGLETLSGVKGRFEVVPTKGDFTVIIDFAHTADGLEKVLTVIDQFATGRKVVVFGAGGNRDKTKRPEMGETVGRHGDLAIVTSDNPRFEDPTKIIDDIVIGISKTNIEYRVIVDRKEAIIYALENAQPNDIILIAGKGHETYIEINGKRHPFDERQIILDYLKGCRNT